MPTVKKILGVISFLLLFPTAVFATTAVFTSSGTWVAPAGVTSAQISAWAAGGAAGDSSGVTSGGAGGGGRKP